MLSRPSVDETRARGVGTQTWRCADRCARNGDDGEQCAGRPAVNDIVDHADDPIVSHGSAVVETVRERAFETPSSGVGPQSAAPSICHDRGSRKRRYRAAVQARQCYD